MPKAGDDVVICIGRETIEALGNGDSPVKVGENEYLLKADSYDYPYRRIAELEKALAPFACLLLNLTTDEIEPRAMFEVSRPDGDDCDLIGGDIIRARRALGK